MNCLLQIKAKYFSFVANLLAKTFLVFSTMLKSINRLNYNVTIKHLQNRFQIYTSNHYHRQDTRKE